MTPVTVPSAILKQYRSSLYLLAICLTILALMFLLTIAKDLQKRRTLETQLADATRRADARELLAPLLAELQGDSGTPLPETTSEDVLLPSEGDILVSVDNYKTVIEEINRKCGMKQVSLKLDLQSILTDKDNLRVNLTARGTFPDFRRLILALSRPPYTLGIEAFRIEKPADTGMLEILLQLRLKLASPVEGVHEPQ